MVHAERFELPTPGSEDQCSIQLSYACKNIKNILYYTRSTVNFLKYKYNFKNRTEQKIKVILRVYF